MLVLGFWVYIIIPIYYAYMHFKNKSKYLLYGEHV
jgi:hypothetical protein